MVGKDIGILKLIVRESLVLTRRAASTKQGKTDNTSHSSGSPRLI